MTFLISMVVGYASHYGLYDLCKTLPFPELASYATGVAIVYPLAKARNDDGDTFEASFWLAFLGHGLGVLIARIVRAWFFNGGNKK